MDTKQKYVRLKQYNQVIIFNPILDHSQFHNFEPISAGFCHVGIDEIRCFGESITLKMKSDKQDSYFATKQIFGIDAAEEHCL